MTHRMDIIMRVSDVSVPTPKVVCVAITRVQIVDLGVVPRPTRQELDKCILYQLDVGRRLPDNIVEIVGERWQTERGRRAHMVVLDFGQYDFGQFDFGHP